MTRILFVLTALVATNAFASSGHNDCFRKSVGAARETFAQNIGVDKNSVRYVSVIAGSTQREIEATYFTNVLTVAHSNTEANVEVTTELARGSRTCYVIGARLVR